MEKLSIAMLSIHSNPIGELGSRDTGGMSVYIRELARQLGRRGHRIDIYTRLQNGGYQPVVDLYENVRLIHLGISNNGNLSKLALYSYLSDFFQSLEAFRTNEKIEYDLIHSHYWLSGCLGNWAQDYWDRPHIAMLHTLGVEKNRTGVGLREPKLRIAAEKELVKSCHRILAPTDREKNSLIRYYQVPERKIGVVPCGVNLDLFQPKEKRAARKRLGFDPDDIMLLYVGRLEPLKGLDRLLEAMTHLQNNSRLRLVIVGGDGDRAPQTQYLRKMAIELGVDGKVMFAGRIKQKRLPSYYSAADILIISSHYESFGLVGLEALACGRPVVSTPVGAMEKLIEKTQAGLVVEKDSAESLAKGIQSIITDFSVPSSDAIHKSVLEYSWSNVADAILKEYKMIIKPQSFEYDGLNSSKSSCCFR
ncbi:MAG: glycosyltransferase [Deltaproteobacteria bacterium]|nr:glycosyltransferase [Deltaproteobacteria bacterium]